MTQKLSTVPALPSSVFISPFSHEANYQALRLISGTANISSGAYVAAQRALYVPFQIPGPVLVKRHFWINGTTAGTDNVQVGVYDSAGNSIALGTAGGTLASGTSQAQFDNVTDYWLSGPARYYMAVWSSGGTTHLLRIAPTANRMRLLGCFQQSSLASGLPTTATFASFASAQVPFFGISLRASP